MEVLRSVKWFLVLSFIMILAHQGSGFQKPAEDAAPFQWLDGLGETSGIKYATHHLRSISLQTESGPPVEIETDESKLDSQTTRIVRRAFSTSPNGTRVLSESTTDEIKRLPGDRLRAVRTVSRPDANGRLAPVRQEIQEMAPLETNVYRITKTVLLSGTNNALEAKERITQIETRSGDKSVEIERTRYLPGANGAWDPAERRVSRNTVDKANTQTDEQVYSTDVNNRLSLSHQLKISESKDDSGRARLQSDSYSSGLEGRLQLTQRVTMVQTPLPDGRQETSQTLERANPAAMNEGLRLVRKVQESVRVHGPNETERHLQVLEPDLNGGLRTVESWQTTEVK